jgi:short-subunit dehydrogenase involved in D-alanine esterification of teichoic acids
MTSTPGIVGTSSSRRQDEDVKIEFINLVEPLIKTMRNTNNNLVQLAAAALVNLCNFSEDIKDIFMQ